MLASVKMPYKPISSEKSQLITQSIMTNQITDFNQQPDDFIFATSEVGFVHLTSQYA